MSEADARTTRGVIGDTDARTTAGWLSSATQVITQQILFYFNALKQALLDSVKIWTP